MDRSGKLRAFYANYVTRLANTKDPKIEQAFAAVPREAFMGPAPWFVLEAPGVGYLPTHDDDLAFLYRDNLIALDRERGINNGQPSLHARCLDALGVQEGQEILHVGAGTGYYAAILAHLVGPAGRVHAFEIDPDLAGRAKGNLAEWPWVDVHACSGASVGLPRVDAIYVNAGLTQPYRAWLDALRPNGRLLFPLQPDQERGFGGMLLMQKPLEGNVWTARFICRAIFIPCEEVSQADETGLALREAFEGGDWEKVRYFHLDEKPDDTCWVKGDGWWLSTRE
jgi:protein-L-isoaspartate(D-aspartate) O-methyltransferase